MDVFGSSDGTVKPTRLYRVDADRPDPAAIQACTDLLIAGGVVAFPTETVYGLGAHALDGEAVRRIFEAKGRPADNPLIIHTDSLESAFSYAVDPPESAYRLAETYWPGPLTLVLKRNDRVPDITTAGLPTFGVRVPAHPVALALLKSCRIPLAAPSANLSGRPSPTTGKHVIDDLWGRIDAVLDAGDCAVGVESTVLDMTVDPPMILRPGGVTVEQIRHVIGAVRLFGGEEGSDGRSEITDTPPSPGLKYRHYAPDAKVIVMDGSPERVAAMINQRHHRGLSRRAGYIVSDETAARLSDRLVGAPIVRLGSRSAPEVAARRLYHALRTLDKKQVDEIGVELFDKQGIGLALADRIRRAASDEDGGGDRK